MIISKLLPIFSKKKSFANSPRDFSISDWKKALIATKDAIGIKRMSILSAGIAFFATIAFFPLLAASVAIASFFINQSELNNIVSALNAYLPSDIANLVATQLKQAVDNESANIVIAVVGILISLFSVSGAFQNLVSALNATYELKDEENVIKARVKSITLMSIGLFIGALVVAILLFNVSILTAFGIPIWVSYVISTGRWIILAVLIATYLAIIYQNAPNKPNPKLQWVTWGSVIATILWMIFMALFFVYARYFAGFSDSYSLFAGIIVLMTWLNLSVYSVLIGAEINHQLEEMSVRKKT